MLNETIVWGDFIAPAGTVVAGSTLTATDTSGNHIGVTLSAGQTSAQLDLTVGTWTVTAQAVDASGAPIGPVATDPQTYTVAAPTTITVQVPTGLSGAVA
jgi:hypothetical protein